MASMEQLEMLAGRALLDQKFLHDFITDPQLAANQVGISLDEDQAERIASFRDKEEALTQIVQQLRELRQGMEFTEPSDLAMVRW